MKLAKRDEKWVEMLRKFNQQFNSAKITAQVNQGLVVNPDEEDPNVKYCEGGRPLGVQKNTPGIPAF